MPLPWLGSSYGDRTPRARGKTIAPAHSLRTASRPASGRRRRQARIAARLKPRDPERPADGGLQPDRNGLGLGFTRFLFDFSNIRLTGRELAWEGQERQ